MAAGNAQKAYNLWAIYTSHFWDVVRIQRQKTGLLLTLDGKRSIDTHNKSKYATYEMALSTLSLYLNRHGVAHFKGQAKEFLLMTGLAAQADFDELERKQGPVSED